MGDARKEPIRMTGPMPWSMLTVSAFVEVQDNCDVCPVIMDSNDAFIFTVGGWNTTTVTESVTVPSGPDAVIV
jgi:hypothetical protein